MRTERTRGRLAFLGAWGLLAALSILWAVATPISASPDEPAHFIKAASIYQGDLVGAPSDVGRVVHAPRYVAHTQARTCFAFDSTETADCSAELTGDPAEVIDVTTTAGLYNPLYYVLVGWPSVIFGDDTGLYVMRIVSALISSALLALVWTTVIAAWGRKRLGPVIGIGAALTPMVFFLGGSLNPNSLEIASVMATFAVCLALVLRPDPERIRSRAVTLAIVAALAANSRGLSVVWLVIIVLAAMLLSNPAQLRGFWASRWIRWAVIVSVATSVIALAWIGYTSIVARDAPPPADFLEAPLVGSSPIVGFLLILMGTFDYGEAIVGTFGWLDTPSPSAVLFVWAALVGALVLAAVALLRGRRLLVAAGLVLTVALVPPVIQAAFITSGGIIWQGRYALPLFVSAMLAVGVLLAGSFARLERRGAMRLVIVIAVGWALAQSYAFFTALQRYSVGLDTSPVEMFRDPSWQPPGGILPLLILTGIITVGIGVATVLSVRRSYRLELGVAVDA